MPLTAAVISGRSKVSLSAGAALKEPTVVPAQHLTLEIEGEDLPETAYLDDRKLTLLRNDARSRAFLMVDAAGSVGFHCLRVADAEWYFATDDAKLKLNGILQILDYLEDEGLSWAGQLFFADGTAVRHPKVDYAWLQRKAPEMLELADAIATRPLRRAHLFSSSQAPGAGRLFLKDTLALLRTNARGLLEENEHGIVAVGDRRYSPRVVVAGRLERSFDIVGNRRMTHLLLLTMALSRSLQSEPRLLGAVTAALRALSEDLRTRLEMFPFLQLRVKPKRLPSRPAPEEIADDRYRRAFDIYDELSREMAWEPGLQIADRLAYVASADQIYQAFVAVVLARAFEAKQMVPSLFPDLSGPLFRSPVHDIYYDTIPPKPEFASWRDGSSRPGDHKPDLTIIDRVGRKGVLTDAKYRVEQNGRLPTSGIHDAQVYLQTFERKSIVICYPGPAASVTRVSAKGYTILEVSLGPFAGLETYAREQVRPVIEGAMEPLGS